MSPQTIRHVSGGTVPKEIRLMASEVGGVRCCVCPNNEVPKSILVYQPVGRGGGLIYCEAHAPKGEEG